MNDLSRNFFFLALVLGLGWGARSLYAAMHDRVLMVEAARRGLEEYATLQETYKLDHGRYAEGMYDLVGVSNDPPGVLANASDLFDHGRVEVTGDRDRFTLSAHAKDPAKTLVALVGPYEVRISSAHSS